MTSPRLADLLPIALDMTASLSAQDRVERLVEVVRRALPCDAVGLLRLEGEDLVPAAFYGLSADALGRRFKRSEHPRFDMICSREKPTLFPAHSDLPDPYDGLVDGVENLGDIVHSCLGCPLRVEGELVGVLTVDALQEGAFDAIDSDFLEYLAALAGAALRTAELISALEAKAEQQGRVARDLFEDEHKRRGSMMLGNSEVMLRLKEEIALFASSDFPVLVTGETGVGKELIVRMLHAQSRRSKEPLVYLNCAAIPESIVESELFGHTRGAFTGADGERPGKFRVADGGTIFLDEIGELPLHIQPKLLRVLQDGEIQQVGSDQTKHVNVRILAATNRSLEQEAKAGRFREDLLHRLDVCRLEGPPLRERRSDIPLLAGHFADTCRPQLGTGPVRFSREAQELLMRSDWPGNVRELENSISRGVLRASGRVAPGEAVQVEAGDVDGVRISETSMPERSTTSVRPVLANLRDATQAFQRDMIRRSVARNKDNWSAAARELGLDRGNMHHLARRLGMK